MKETRQANSRNAGLDAFPPKGKAAYNPSANKRKANPSVEKTLGDKQNYPFGMKTAKKSGK